MVFNNTQNEVRRFPSISVIVPFHGDIKDLSNCLKGLRNQKCGFPFEVIIVESGNDNEIKKLISLNHNVTFISSDSIIFPGKARNIGAANSESNFLAFTDADCISSAGWISEMYSSLKNGYKIVVGPIINLYPFHPVASIDNLLVILDFQKRSASNNVKRFPGCNFGIKKELFLETGGFSEELEIGEDTKFSESVLEKCSKIFYNPKMVVRHSGRKNFFKFIEHQKNFGYNRKYLNQKKYPGLHKFRRTFLYSLLFGFRRLAYISFRVLQRNPFGFFRLIIYSPFLLIGLSAWVKGFWDRNKKLPEKQN